jgi:hypothetical protein
VYIIYSISVTNLNVATVDKDNNECRCSCTRMFNAYYVAQLVEFMTVIYSDCMKLPILKARKDLLHVHSI